MTKIEYRVRSVTRYFVTRFEASENSCGSTQHGEFDNHDTAYAVAYALANAETTKDGGIPDKDMEVIFPDPIPPGQGVVSTGVAGSAL